MAVLIAGCAGAADPASERESPSGGGPPSVPGGTVVATDRPATGPCTSDADCDEASPAGCGCEPLLRTAPHTPYVRPCGTSEAGCEVREPYCDLASSRCALRPAP